MSKLKIPFNKPYISGKEMEYIADVFSSGHISGNGKYTKKCQQFFEENYGFKKALLTTSCTDALEMCAMLLNIKPGDEVIVPSYTFVSSALAFSRQGAVIVFADSGKENPNLDVSKLEKLITKKTKAIVVVHYAGIAVDMDKVMALSKKYKIKVVEDAAQSINSFYKKKPLGGIGHLGAFSFHETKNIHCGEGGMLVINDKEFIKRAEIIWEKGTNRAAFFRGEVDKYGWVDTGSSFLPSELNAAFLFAQLENLEAIQAKRKKLWNTYAVELKKLEASSKIKLPQIPGYAINNANVFYLLLGSAKERSELINHLKKQGIQAVFHYLSLHASSYYLKNNPAKKLPVSDYYSNHLLRLPLYNSLSEKDIKMITNAIKKFYS